MDETTVPSNDEIAGVLERIADLLEAQEASRYRIAAYRRGAETIRAEPRAVAKLYAEGGKQAVDALPTIGPTIAAHVAEIVQRGSIALLERLLAETPPERLFASVPGIGPELGRRIHDGLGIETLEDLEQSAHDGRLATIRGFGPRRIRAVREQLAALLSRESRLRSHRRASPSSPRDAETSRPDVETLLALDAEYRARAAAGELKRIAPRRFNPRHETWLPILETKREGWRFSVLFSNTALAHELERTSDWVVIYYEKDGRTGQCTVVTETTGVLRGQRVVRGRERECRARASPSRSASRSQLHPARPWPTDRGSGHPASPPRRRRIRSLRARSGPS
jgi:DNA polymerase (family X)